MATPSHLIEDLSIPGALLEPGLWPDAQSLRREPWILRCELLVLAGGPLVQWMRAALESGPVVWRLSPTFWLGSSLDGLRGLHSLRGLKQSDEFTRHSLKPFLLHPNTSAIWYDGPPFQILVESIAQELAGESSHGVPSVLPASHTEVSAPSPIDWARAMFPSVATALGPSDFIDILRDHLDRHAIDMIPWRDLGYFPAFLRTRVSQDLAEAAACDQARLQALYSPQDENQEARRLPAGIVKLNPTLQIVRSGRGRSAHASLFVRRNARLFEKQMDWQEAAVLDELSEVPRSSLQDLLNHLRLEYPDQDSSVVGRLVPTRSFSLVLNQMIADQIVLRGEHGDGWEQAAGDSVAQSSNS